MRIVILGGDGFCGWPTALRLSNKGHEVSIVDNGSRRLIDEDTGTQSLTPIESLENRVKAWKDITGKTIKVDNIDVAGSLTDLTNYLARVYPDVVIHFAEQRSAPYSMKSSTTRSYTVSNNINATHNILNSLVESGCDAHLIHLGTMGVYGYGGVDSDIPEGYVDVEIGGESRSIIYPADPGSIYHMTKCQDALMFQYYNKNYGLRITDLHQGIVWGVNTVETSIDERLVNRFDYDGDYGTVLNRFIVQASNNHPLTVHGVGGQTRAFINIEDSIECINLAVDNPPPVGDKVEIFNQMTETYSVGDLACIVSDVLGSEVSYIDNPRNEAVYNKLSVCNKKFIDLGLDPNYMTRDSIENIGELCIKYSYRFNESKILCKSNWN